MEFLRLRHFLICVFVAISVGELKEDALQTQTCHFKVTDCNYTLLLSPSDSCHGDKDFQPSRSKRSVEVKLPPQMDLLAKKIKRVQNKLTREIQQLSTRVLRGIRRVETVAMELVDKETKEGGANFRNCPSGFVSVDNWKFCYLMSKFNTSWYEAKDYCNALDSQMVSLFTLKEHYIVTYLIRNNPEVHQATGWWTSGMFFSKTKQWVWSSDLGVQPLTYIKWAPSEPDEMSLQCIALHLRDDFLWHDELCSHKYNFVCKVGRE